MTRRNLVHISREPAQLSDVTVQPVIFTALFVYIFGGGSPIPHGTYKDYVLAGVLSHNLVTSTLGTGVGLSTNLHEGIIDRFRALPIWRASVLVGRSLADLATFVLCVLIVGVTGLAVGRRPHAGPGAVADGFALVLLFAYSLTWIAICVGLTSKSPESAASTGFIVFFPLAFVSNAMIPTQHMPGWLRVVADWNP
jgi:ABC-2 type transport system permease protein